MILSPSQSASKQLYEASVHLVGTYAKHNIGRRTLEARGEEDQWRDLQLLMELLTSLLSKVGSLGHSQPASALSSQPSCYLSIFDYLCLQELLILLDGILIVLL